MTTYNPHNMLKNVRILIVEDDAFIAKVYEKWLTLAGAGVVTATDGAIGLRELKERLIDVVILDLGMPGMNGIDTLRAIRKEKSTERMPVIIMSNTTMQENRTGFEEIRKAGVHAILRKYEVSLKETVECVKECVQSTGSNVSVA